MKYILQDIPAVLAKANQGLATLDKYRARLDAVSSRLTRLEFEGGSVLYDVLSVLQRAELVTRMAVEVERYIVELGTEGRLIEMQLEETMVGVAADKAALIRDYSVEDTEENLATTLSQIARLPHQDLLDFGRLAELLGYDRKVSHSRLPGLLARLPRAGPDSAAAEAGGAADHPGVRRPGGGARRERRGPRGRRGRRRARAKDIREGLRRLQEIDPVDRYLQS